MLFRLTALLAAFACASATAAPPAKVVGGAGGGERINLPMIDIEGTVHGGAGSKVPCGDCRDGIYNPKKPAPVAPAPAAPPAKTPQQIELEARQAYEDAAILYVRKLRKDEEPLENESMVTKWLLDKAKNKLFPSGPWGTILDSLESTTGGVSEFDQAKDKGEMKRLREELDAEERTLRRLKEENEKLYNENMKLLEPKLEPEERARGLASLPELNRMQETLVARASLKSDDYGAVVKHVLSRTRFDADIRMPAATYQKVAREIWRTTPSNVCLAPATPASPEVACLLNGFRKGSPCICPNPMGFHLNPVVGTATRFPVGSICRNGNVAIDLRGLYPRRVSCNIPVDTTLNPMMPTWSYVRGQISEK